MSLALDYPRIWIPIDEGDPNCCCCGLHFGSAFAACGRHAYCSICQGRDHDEDHDCADYDTESLPFRRIEHDCPGCGERHQDWERCSHEVWRRYQVMKARGDKPGLGEHKPWRPEYDGRPLEDG